MSFLLAFTAVSLAAQSTGAYEDGEIEQFEAPAEDTGVVGCTDQSLSDGVLLPDLPLFYTRESPAHAWGTAELIDVLVDTSRQMHWLLPDASPITLGDLSARRGGPLSTHISHRGGVDADVGIYHTGARQTGAFYPLGDDFDSEANWMLVSTLLQTDKVDFILLDMAHIERLRTYTLSRALVSEEEADRIFAPGFTTEPGYLMPAPNHTDHLHLRVLCADGSRAR